MRDHTREALNFRRPRFFYAPPCVPLVMIVIGMPLIVASVKVADEARYLARAAYIFEPFGGVGILLVVTAFSRRPRRHVPFPGA